MNREAELKRDIAGLDALTAEIEAAAGDLLKGGELSPSNARAREEVIELLGVNYVGPESLGQLLYGDENRFPQVELDYVRLKEILNEADEWETDSKKFETYALVFKPPISFLELRDRANEMAIAYGQTWAFFVSETDSWYLTEAFATEAPDTGSWELVRRETVPGSDSKVLEDQKALIADKPILTTASFPALASLLVGQYLAHDIKLYDGGFHYGRTSTCAASVGPVSLGYSHPGGAPVSDRDMASDHVGLAVSRKLN